MDLASERDTSCTGDQSGCDAHRARVIAYHRIDELQVTGVGGQEVTAIATLAAVLKRAPGAEVVLDVAAEGSPGVSVQATPGAATAS